MNKGLLAVFFCTIMCHSVFSQHLTVKNIQETFIKNAAGKYIDSLRQLLSGNSLAARLKPANKILLRTSAKQPAAKLATTSTIDPCGYLCSAGCPVIPTWVGAIDSNYFNAGNWCTGIMPLDTNVFIPSIAPNFPVATGDTVKVNNLTIVSPGRLTIADLGVLKIKGAIVSDSGLNAKAGTVVYAGIVQQTIAKNTYTNNSIKHLVINNKSGVLLGGLLKVVSQQAKRIMNDPSIMIDSTMTQTNRGKFPEEKVKKSSPVPIRGKYSTPIDNRQLEN